MLSATPVQNGTISFAHQDGKALQDAVDLFSNLTILKDHMFSVDNWLGRTEGAFWDTTTAGAPFGITGMMRLDTKSDPKVVRGLLSGALDSVSVTISFDYEKSHPKMNDSEFFMNLGEVVDGKTVQALVTKINRVYELSVVWQGADQFAKTVNDGTINTPGIPNSQSLQPTTSSLKEESVDPKKLAALLGLTLGDNPTEAQITEALQESLKKHKELETKLTETATAAAELQTQVTALTTAVTDKTNEVTALNTTVEELKPQAELGTKFLADTRSEALRLYNLCEDKKATPAMQTLIGNANLEVAQSFIGTYKDRAEQIAPLKCTKCGCTELSRQAAKQQDVTPDNKTVATGPKADRLKANVASIHS
jgi:hypothetical protein